MEHEGLKQRVRVTVIEGYAGNGILLLRLPYGSDRTYCGTKYERCSCIAIQRGILESSRHDGTTATAATAAGTDWNLHLVTNSLTLCVYHLQLGNTFGLGIYTHAYRQMLVGTAC